MSLNDFEILKRLGEGAYSSVYHVRRINDGDFYALKKVRMMKLSDKEKENALNEVRILASIHHPNIVAYKEAFIDEPSSSLCIVMEYADSGDLFQQICDHQKNNTLFKEDDIWKMFIQMVRGLKCLHEIMIFHRDLKSANVFLNKDGTAKLGDMNVSKVAKKGLLYTQTGTPYYASPEVWRDQPYDHKSDIWSLGCVLYESITLKPPFRAEDMQGLYKKVLRGIYPKIPHVFSNDLSHLVKSLIQVSPQLRPNCDKILDMPVIKKRMEKLFPHDTFYDSQTSLLNTIRVPKNLLYLTDRLPKPTYESPIKNEEERLRRKTHDAGAMLPDIKNQKHKNGKLPPTGTKKQKSSVVQSQPQVPTINQKQTRVRSEMIGQSQDEDIVSAGGKTSHMDEDRRSVISKQSIVQYQSKETKSQLEKENQQPRKQKSITSKIAVQPKKEEGSTEEYENENFERDEHNNGQLNSPSKNSIDEAESQKDTSPGITNITPVSKRSHLTKISSPSQQMMHNRPSGQNPVSVERIQVYKGNPSLIQNSNGQYISGQNHESNTTSKKNLAYINITGDGARPVGHLGMKKAEKDLIMRRYKYNHVNDNIQRVALIYGNPNNHNPSNHSSSPYQQQQNNHASSPYLNNPGLQANNISGIIKRNKYMLDDSNNQGYMKLPRIQSLGRQEDLLSNQSSKLLPPIVGISGNQSNNGGIVINKNSNNLPPTYQPYILKPSKMKNLSKPLLSSGISGEKMVINQQHYGYRDGTSNSLVDTSGIQNTQASSHGGNSPPQIQNHNRKMYRKKNQLGNVKAYDGRNATGASRGLQELTGTGGPKDQ